jgi:hypothetical protein
MHSLNVVVRIPQKAGEYSRWNLAKALPEIQGNYKSSSTTLANT